MNQRTPPTFSPQAQSLKIGKRYEHFKGFPYRVLAIAFHSETNEELVVYQALYEEELIWVRPVSMFVKTVEYNGRKVPRFKPVED